MKNLSTAVVKNNSITSFYLFLNYDVTIYDDVNFHPSTPMMSYFFLFLDDDVSPWGIVTMLFLDDDVIPFSMAATPPPPPWRRTVIYTLLIMTLPILPELVRGIHSSSNVFRLTLMRIRSLFFVRTVPVWNALSSASVHADCVTAFHSSIRNSLFHR